MITTSGVLLVALVIVIALQVANRLAGSAAAIAWCFAVTWWGWMRLEGGAELHFFGIRSDKRVFLALMLGFAAYNAFLIFRELKRRNP